jgi:bifunctional non-homologous end joining protein LigD
MVLKPATTLPRSNQRLYELKFDGFRGLAVNDGKDARLFSRNGGDFSKWFPTIVEAVRKLQHDRPSSMARLFAWMKTAGRVLRICKVMGGSWSEILFFYAFDLLHLNGSNLHARPIEERKTLLHRLLPADGPIR